jgi:hypothetical protein
MLIILIELKNLSMLSNYYYFWIEIVTKQNISLKRKTEIYDGNDSKPNIKNALGTFEWTTYFVFTSISKKIIMSKKRQNKRV